MSKLDRAAARERCEKATPGPWEQFSYKYGHLDNGQIPQRWEQFTADDELFTEHARTDLPLALAELDQKDALIASQAAEIASLRDRFEVERRVFREQAALIQSMREALVPFVESLRDNYANQPDNLNIWCGSSSDDRRWITVLGEWRAARAALAQVSASPKEEQPK